MLQQRRQLLERVFQHRHQVDRLAPGLALLTAASAAELAATTAGVDLADDAPPLKLRRARSPLDLAHELVPERPLEPRVPAHDLQIGVAYARQPYAHQRLALAPGHRYVRKA